MIFWDCRYTTKDCDRWWPLRITTAGITIRHNRVQFDVLIDGHNPPQVEHLALFSHTPQGEMKMLALKQAQFFPATLYEDTVSYVAQDIHNLRFHVDAIITNSKGVSAPTGSRYSGEAYNFQAAALDSLLTDLPPEFVFSSRGVPHQVRRDGCVSRKGKYIPSVSDELLREDGKGPRKFLRDTETSKKIEQAQHPLVGQALPPLPARAVSGLSSIRNQQRKDQGPDAYVAYVPTVRLWGKPRADAKYLKQCFCSECSLPTIWETRRVVGTRGLSRPWLSCKIYETEQYCCYCDIWWVKEA